MPIQIRIIAKFKDFKKLLEDMCANGYGDLPAVWAILLWLNRN